MLADKMVYDKSEILRFIVLNKQKESGKSAFFETVN